MVVRGDYLLLRTSKEAPASTSGRRQHTAASASCSASEGGARAGGGWHLQLRREVEGRVAEVISLGESRLAAVMEEEVEVVVVV